LLLFSAAVLLQLFQHAAHHSVGRIEFERFFQIYYGRHVIHFAGVGKTNQSEGFRRLRIEFTRSLIAKAF